MKSRKQKTVLFRRKRELKTNYRKRLRLLFARKPRLVVRMTNSRVLAQVVSFESKGDIVQVGVDSSNLRKYGWGYSMKNYPAAYLTGVLVAKRSLAKGITEAILDTGFNDPAPKGKVYAFLLGALDGGLQVPHGEDNDIFPDKARVSGKHIGDYAKGLKGKDFYTLRFADYLKNKVSPEDIEATFETVKVKIMQEKATEKAAGKVAGKAK